jgi:hypothetical protein
MSKRRFLSILVKGMRFSFADSPETTIAILGRLRVRDGYVDILAAIVEPDGNPSRASQLISVRDQQVIVKD